MATLFRKYMSSNQHGRVDRKTMQLCRQIQKALLYAFSSTGCDVVASLMVEEVTPAPNASRLLVVVSSLDGDLNAAEAISALAKVAPKLRQEVSAAINRRKTPELSFHFRDNDATELPA